MLIDWFTVGAQALNFVVLVWLLKRFLYKPILQTIDAREKRIAGEIADADARKAEAHAEREEFSHKSEAFDRERGALLRRAIDDGKAERQRLIEAARVAGDAASAQWQDTLRNEARNLNRALRRRAQEEVFAIARKVLADLATTSLEERLCEVFTRRLRELGGPAKEQLATALATATAPTLVRSTFGLTEAQCATIRDALEVASSAAIRVHFETTPDLIAGIELNANGQKLAWSIADYLMTLEKGVTELLDQQVEAKPALTSDNEPQLLARA